MPGGDPDGIRTIEKSNWSGTGIVFPRSLMLEAKGRPELSRTGVYVLTGPPEESGLPRVYIGEGDPIRPRLDQHAIKKDFWTSCIAFTSKDGNLNKAHVQFIESRLVDLANAAKRCKLDNANFPALPSLSESDAADAEGFLSEMRLCFPVFGLGVFVPAPPSRRDARRLFLVGRGAKAEGEDSREGFIVRAGSEAASSEARSCPDHLKSRRAALLANGVLLATSDRLVFAQDYVFDSPSAAAGVLVGGSANGRAEWKTANGISLKEMQEAEDRAR
jgi:hypothetical protein